MTLFAFDLLITTNQNTLSLLWRELLRNLFRQRGNEEERVTKSQRHQVDVGGRALEKEKLNKTQTNSSYHFPVRFHHANH